MADESQDVQTVALRGARATISVPTPLSAAGVVLVGRFNPAIFQPAWMATHKLLRDEEATNAKNFVAIPDLLTFGTAWMHLQVSSDRFEVLCTEGGHEGPLKDLVIGIFTLLEHTPFEQMGLNSFRHTSLSSEDEWEQIQRRVFVSAAFGTILNQRRLRSLSVLGEHANAPGARIQINIEPSVRVQPGFFVGTNEHYQETGIDAGRRLIDTLNRRWADALVYANQVASHVQSLRHREPPTP